MAAEQTCITCARSIALDARNDFAISTERSTRYVSHLITRELFSK